MDDCIFCNVVNKKIDHAIYFEDNYVIAFLDKNPVMPGHTLLIPKNHIDYIFNIDNELYIHLFNIAKKLSETIKKVTNSKRVGVIISGFQVSHAHIHLIPINNDRDLLNSAPQFISESENQQMALLLKSGLNF